jgi:hypothetical protein
MQRGVGRSEDIMADIGSKIDEVIAQDEQEVTVTIYQPSGEPYVAADGKTECTVTVIGRESKAYRRAKDVQQKRMLNGGRGAKLEPEDLRANRVALAVGAMRKWSGWEMDGGPAELNRENAQRLLRADHILEQVEDAIDKHAVFFARASQS